MEKRKIKPDVVSTTIKLLKAGGKNGHVILRKDYESINTLILETLKTHHEISLFDLLDVCNREFTAEFKGNLPWYLLNVKQDLQAKGLIQIKRDKKRIQIVSLKKQKMLSS